MRAERLGAIAREIINDLYETEVIERVGELVDALDELASNPTDATEAAVAAARQAVTDAVYSSRVSKYPPALQDVMAEMRIDHLFGSKLLADIDSDIQKNGITPGVARDAVSSRLSYLKTLQKQAKAIVEALVYFEVGFDELAPGEFELMIQIPGEAIDEELGQLGKEAQRLNAILGVFTEIATGSREPIKLRGLGSSDPTFFLDSLPATAALFATAVERIAAFYAQIQGIIKTHRDMKAQEVPTPVIDGMKKHIDDSIKTGLDKIAKDIEKESMKHASATRKPELRSELKKSLYEIARRIDEGYVFDVRGAPPPELVDDEAPTADQSAAERAYQIVEEARPRIQHFQSESEPILSLPREEEG
jgi:hypothetical protein